MAGWVLFAGDSRRRFFDEVGADDAMVRRSRGWAIAPSLTGITCYRDVPHLLENARRSLEVALAY